MDIQKCGVYKKCSGCQLMNMTYEQQLRWKQIKVERLLGKFCKVNRIIGMKSPYHYRNTVHTLFRPTVSGKIVSGVYQSSTNGIVGVESCLLNNKRADRIAIAVKTVAKRLGISIYNPKTGKGFLKNTFVRVSDKTGETMLVIVTANGEFPKPDEFVSEVLYLYPKITTIIHNINPYDRMTLGNKEYVMYGKGTIQDIICKCKFNISPKSFYQVNSVQTEILYNKAIEIANLTGKETVLDAYCGTGTIGIIASKYAKFVTGVELNPQAIIDAKINSELNKVHNIRFYQKDAGAFLNDLAEDKEIGLDVMFVDPPRAGFSKEFLNAVSKITPKTIVYISCNPVTQQRDVLFLTKQGYNVKEVQPVDMFPHTNHVECVILMSR